MENPEKLATLDAQDEDKQDDMSWTLLYANTIT